MSDVGISRRSFSRSLVIVNSVALVSSSGMHPLRYERKKYPFTTARHLRGFHSSMRGDEIETAVRSEMRYASIERYV